MNHLTETYLAARLSVSRRTLQKWRKAGEGPPFMRLGGAIRYNVEDVERWERERSSKQAQGGFTVIELMILVAIIGILAAIVVPAWNSRNDPTETLKTKEWTCLKQEERKYIYPLVVGKVTTMQTGWRTECVEWRRK